MMKVEGYHKQMTAMLSQLLATRKGRLHVPSNTPQDYGGTPQDYEK